MRKKTLYSILILVLLAVSLSACTRTLPGRPAATEVPTRRPTTVLSVATATKQSTAVAEAPAPTHTTTINLPVLTGASPTPTEPPAAPTVPPTVPPTPIPPTAISAPVLIVDDLDTTGRERPEKYRLRKGEYPFCIARRFDVDPNELLRVNGLVSNEQFQARQVLWIPQYGSFPGQRAIRRHPDQYEVQRKDTIYTIACEYGDIDPMDIVELNGLSEPYDLFVGQILLLPDAPEYAGSEYGTGGAYDTTYYYPTPNYYYYPYRWYDGYWYNGKWYEGNGYDQNWYDGKKNISRPKINPDSGVWGNTTIEPVDQSTPAP